MEAGPIEVTGGSLFVLASVQLALTAAPGVAAVLLGLRLGARREPVLLALALAASGLGAMLTFWVYYANQGVGGPCAYALFFGSFAVGVWSWREASRHRDLLRRLSVPLGLWALGSLFVIFFGFLHGGTQAAAETAATRFSTQPTQFGTDNFIPLFFSEWMFAGHPGPPPVFPPDWLFSDRPPLQVAYILTQHIFGWDTMTLHYELLGVMLQQLWIVGMWALLRAAGVSSRTRALAMVAALLSEVAIVNAFFVWPKLMGAAFLLAALALVASPRPGVLREQPWTVVLIGALVGLAFLSHGTSLFGVVPIAALGLWRGLPGWRWLAAGATAFLILVLPWIAYQHYGDPPGNRLLKWHLAGVVQIDDRGVLEATRDEYGRVGLGGALENKLDNFLEMAGGDFAPPNLDRLPHGDVVAETGDVIGGLAEGRFGAAASKVRETMHWHLLWSPGLLLLALPLIAFGRWRNRQPDDEDWRFARLCLLFVAIGAFAWGLIMFGNGVARTYVSTGTLAMPLLMIVGLVAGLRATYPRWAGWLVAADVLAVLVVYTPTLTTPHGGYWGFAAFGTLGALAGFLALAFSSRAGEPRARLALPFHRTPAGATAVPAEE